MCSLNRRFELFMAIYRVFELDAVFKWLHPPPPFRSFFLQHFRHCYDIFARMHGCLLCVYTALWLP